MHPAAAALALLIGICGWYYLFFSKAVTRLGGIEDAATNRRRAILRRINGAAMFLLAWGFYAGFFAIDPDQSPHAFVAVWTGVLILLLIIVLLAVADLRYTTRLRRRPRQ
jgi:hypothetical protein